MSTFSHTVRWWYLKTVTLIATYFRAHFAPLKPSLLAQNGYYEGPFS